MITSMITANSLNWDKTQVVSTEDLNIREKLYRNACVVFNPIFDKLFVGYTFGGKEFHGQLSLTSLHIGGDLNAVRDIIDEIEMPSWFETPIQAIMERGVSGYSNEIRFYRRGDLIKSKRWCVCDNCGKLIQSGKVFDDGLHFCNDYCATIRLGEEEVKSNIHLLKEFNYATNND